MTFFKQITVFLVIFSQFCLAFHNRTEFVFCVKDNGNFAIEPSINGVCEDSKKWLLKKVNTHSTQINKKSPPEDCKDYTIYKIVFKPENAEKSFPSNHSHAGCTLIIPYISNFQAEIFKGYIKTPLFVSATALSLRRIVVLLI